MYVTFGGQHRVYEGQDDKNMLVVLRALVGVSEQGMGRWVMGH